MRISTPALALSAALILTLSACGSSDPEPAATTGSPTGSPAAAAECPPVEGAQSRTTTFSAPPPMCIDAAKAYTADFTTDAGTFKVALDAKKAPQTVNNFVFLARNKFYDGVVFHRVIKGFMNQGGDPEGTGRGGPGYTIPDEFPQEGEYEVGSIAMANTGAPNSGGSQFFIVTGDAGVGLPAQYSLFGKVTEGMETVKKIEADGSDTDGPPAKVHTIESVTITEG